MTQHIYDNFARQGIMRTFGAQLSALGTGTAEMTAPIQPATSQQQGFAHAGLTFSLGDSAGGYAALTLLGADQDVVTSEIKINLVSPARGDSLVARGRVIKPGKRLIVIMSEVFAVTDGTEKLVAILTGTMVPVPVVIPKSPEGLR